MAKFGDYCVTQDHEVTIYVGDLNGSVLTSISPPFEGRADYTAEEVVEKRAKYEKAKKLADAARSDLSPFGENDR